MKAKKFTLSLLLSIALGVSSFSQTGYAIPKSSETDDISSNNTIFLPKENYEFSDLSNLKIETERLIITPTNENDLDKLAEYLQNPQVTQYLDPTITEGFKTKAQALDFLKSEGSGEYNSALEYTIKLKSSGTPIGKLDLMLFPDSSGKNSILSIGYWLGKDFQGKGYMGEACFELCNKAIDASDVKLFYIACDTRNEKSSKLADRIFDYIEKNNTAKFYRSKSQHRECCNFGDKEISFENYSFILQKIK